MRSHPGVAARMFRTLADEGINLRLISTSPIKVSCLIPRSDVERRFARCTRRSGSASSRLRAQDEHPERPHRGPRRSQAEPRPPHGRLGRARRRRPAAAPLVVRRLDQPRRAEHGVFARHEQHAPRRPGDPQRRGEPGSRRALRERRRAGGGRGSQLPSHSITRASRARDRRAAPGLVPDRRPRARAAGVPAASSRRRSRRRTGRSCRSSRAAAIASRRRTAR